jgi:hypothetical protein
LIDAKRLLDDLKRLLRVLEGDLRERAGAVAEMNVTLQREHRAARDAGRTGEAFEVWREGMLTQAAVAWLLACVFVRFMEDNGLVEEAFLSGPGERRSQAADRQILYFQQHPLESDRDYLYDVFRTAQKLPAVAKLFDEYHSPIWAYSISGDEAKGLIAFWRQVVPETGALVHDFTDATWNTRFLGDLYQDLSEEARKRYALLQTPEFVEEFILDRTLEPAIEEFGLKEVRLIDPTCGSGHFLLGAFRRILDRWFRIEPGTVERELVQRALDAVYGVDLNPYAVAIARFRLLVAALRASGINKLKEEPGFRINVAVGDSLLHGRRFGELDLGDDGVNLRHAEGIGHVYREENLEQLNRILGQQYHVVVGNPPYITMKDRGLNQAYRKRFSTCHRQYSLVVPFTERFFDLAIYGADTKPAGYVGMITANSFMKREFGKKLIEEFFPRIDLTHVIDTSGAYIPGHGTPTVILFGRHRAPVNHEVRAVLGIRGEPSTPDDPAQGKARQSIIDHLDKVSEQNEFVSITNLPRETLAKHPWSIGGGGAAELKTLLEDRAATHLEDFVTAMGRVTHTGSDEAYFAPHGAWLRVGIPQSNIVTLVEGDTIRDWSIVTETDAIFPYDEELTASLRDLRHPVLRHLWLFKQFLVRRREPGGTHEEIGLTWYEWSRFQRERFLMPLSIAIAFVATHNHFVLDRGGKVFNRSAPVIKLTNDAAEEDHLALMGLLNSSTACFWGRQVFFPKGGFAAGKWEERLEWDGTKLRQFPIPAAKPSALPHFLDRLASEYHEYLPNALARKGVPTAQALADARSCSDSTLMRMIAAQEELDWQCYRLYGLINENLQYQNDPPPIKLGQRAFEIVMARKMAAGELETTWFERHRSKPITEIPDHWPDEYKRLVERRIAVIEGNNYIDLIERPEYKRRWNTEPWEEQEKRALRSWLLNRLEGERYWSEPHLQTTRTLANRAQTDHDFMQVAELYRGHAGFDVHALVAELVEAESVPFLPILRYKTSGLRKRDIWERTWALQRREDLIDAEVAAALQQRADGTAAQLQERLKAEQRRRKQQEIGDTPPPPKYTSADFQNSTFWRLRGALDVPKERFISYPYCFRESDPTLVIGWAGWDHLQQAMALAAWYTEVVEQEAWSPERLKPLLAGIAELLPWLKQWHNDIDPEFNERMGDFFEGFLRAQLQQYGLTHEDLKRWTPPATGRARGELRRRS